MPEKQAYGQRSVSVKRHCSLADFFPKGDARWVITMYFVGIEKIMVVNSSNILLERYKFRLRGGRHTCQ